jgi:hypothetical protein
MSETPTQRNWTRILEEARAAVSRLDGPVPGKTWNDLGGGTAKGAFDEAVMAILQAELANRIGDTTRVNVDINDALKKLGEQLARAEAPAARQGASDA